ncbi:hypothetical protein ACROYT_G025212 [Oculina patagonica]
MKKTLVTFFVLLLFIATLLHVETVLLAVRSRCRSSEKRLYRDGNFEGLSAFVPNDSGKRIIQVSGDQNLKRRNICLSARELDCEKELQDQ